jgi:hypothetical protein
MLSASVSGTWIKFSPGATASAHLHHRRVSSSGVEFETNGSAASANRPQTRRPEEPQGSKSRSAPFAENVSAEAGELNRNKTY